ncbi:MAG: hypothetical protein ABIQ55_04405 [Gemmatimonadaceae bacterium]
MSRRSSPALFAMMTFAATVLACTDIPTGTDQVLSFAVNPLPSPSVVVGDTLRDSLGVVKPITVSAFNFQGDTVRSPRLRFLALSRGIRVDSLTGVVTGDSVQAGAQIIASVGAIQSIVSIGVALRPDTMISSNGRDSLSYSLTDTTLNTSPALGVKLLHGKGADSAVVGYRVSFRTISPTGTLALLVNDVGAAGTTADTTDASGLASRRIRLNVAQLTSATDSVVVMASASYRGVAVGGSPVRLVLKYKLKS